MKLELFIPATQGVRVACEISSKLLYIITSSTFVI